MFFCLVYDFHSPIIILCLVFDKEVRMWVFQEQVEGRNLTDIINEVRLAYLYT